MTVTRTIALDDLHPGELAEIFANYASDDQARFFNTLAIKVKDWPGTGWCMQSSEIAPKLTHDGKAVVTKLAEWIEEQGA